MGCIVGPNSFVWGSCASGRRLSLVHWEDIPQPLNRGGLGIPRARECNEAFMHKLADMWVLALRQKYRMFSIFPLSITWPNCSPLWRAISQAWNIVREQIYWIMGDGELVNMWTDNWIPALGPLRHRQLP
ncbi:hypothetical protein V6N12_076383 [Hibiscus sabdariffa]|uniref:Reverse transcriptase zinc-binding domain-containing protein n=1 Tax=Hibiscus sabdariffa TaxID=183260 RepID=A0ABR2D9N2_9ROSI